MYEALISSLNQSNCTLVAVSKTKPQQAILELYKKGQRIFGENRVQELVTKYEDLPKDIQWHMIGQLQRNKVKYIAPFVSLIHSVGSFQLAKAIDGAAQKNNRVIPILLQIKIAKEATKSGFSFEELLNDIDALKLLDHIEIQGVMGMGTFGVDQSVNQAEFEQLKYHFDYLKANQFKGSNTFETISMGMSGDYQLAIDCGSTMVRIGSLLFGSR